MLERPRRLHRAILALGLTSLVFAPVAASAQAAGLPPAREIIARYAQAVGGDGWKKHKSTRMKATMDMAGMSASMEVVQIFGSGVASKMTLAGMGEIRSGYDGTTAWMMNPMMGPQILTGAQADAIKDEADPENSLRSSANVTNAETIEKTTMNGQECYKVKLTWKSGRESTDCYSVSDGLLVATMQKVPTQMGEMETTILQSDYKDFGGIKRATKMTTEMMGQQQTVTVTSWEWDNVDPKELELPAEIKALVKKPA